MDKAQPLKGKAFWGPPLWTTLHILAVFLTVKSSIHFKKILKCYTELKPCEKCKKHFKMNLISNPPDLFMDSNMDTFFYTYVMHDIVNQQIESEGEDVKVSPDYKEIQTYYFKNITEKGEDFWSPVLWSTIHIFAATLRPENAKFFISFIYSVVELLPHSKMKNSLSKSMRIINPYPYLTNNHDAFFYTYIIYDLSSTQKTIDYNDLKNFYFRSLSQECKDCKV